MIRGFDFNIRKIILSLLLISGVTITLHSQTNIGGVINQYSHVESVGGLDNVTVTDASSFNAGDTVLLIQMKGAIILGLEDNSYGTYQYSQGTPGAYEFLIIQSVNYLSRNIVFTRRLANVYDISGFVQLIRVPYYNSATVTSELRAQPWDSLTTKTGGVLAMIVGGTLNLNANINVSSMGFSGGVPSPGDGICTNVNSVLYDKYAYPAISTNSGFKGEGLVTRVLLSSTTPPVFPDFAKGKGANFTAGGGGNGRFSGGGGGSGAGGISETVLGSGGNGGVESDAVCGAGFQFGNGLGGKTLYNNISGAILPGSGGGSSTYGSGGTATPGGHGGGIIIIICDTLKGNNKTISARGETPAGSSIGNAGAGGGGGGGTIALYQQSFSTQVSTSALILTASGGNGGNASNRFGEGGGGGGGLVLTNNLTYPANLSISATGGSPGTRTGGSLHANPGLTGGSTKTFSPLLNGFLFNKIHSSASNNQIDSVCSNMRPPKIIGTVPVGGSGTYSIVWQKSYESTFASPIILTNDAQPLNYTPTLADAISPTDTVWFRRVVMDTGAPPITDISKPVQILVHTLISNNIVGTQDTICYSGNPPLIGQLIPDLIVPSTNYLFFMWQDSSSESTWKNIATGTGKEFDPADGLLNTTRYRRIVTSGTCIDTSLTVEMTVLPLITGNKIRIRPPEDDSVCYGTQFNELIGAEIVGGGDNTYKYRWESSYNYSVWGTAPGISDRDSILPVLLPAERIPENYYRFRRVVYSGKDDVCIDISDTIHLRDFPLISNNLISTLNPLVCYGSVPERINGNLPNNGNGYYTWQDSSGSSPGWKNITGFIYTTDREYQPAVLTTTTSYRRITHSSGCSDTSSSIKITVLLPIDNNIISLSSLAADTIICNGQSPRIMIGTDNPSGGAGAPFSYQWLRSPDQNNYTLIAGADQPDYPDQPPLVASTYFKRLVIDRQSICIDTSLTTVFVNVLPPISNNYINVSEATICENTTPDQVSGTAPAGGSGSYLFFWDQSTDNGVTWVEAEGLNNLSGYQPPLLFNSIMYRRRVISGFADCCSDTSLTAEISINQAPDSPVNAGLDESIYSLDRTYIMKADPPVIQGESGYWTALDPGTAIINNISDSKTQIRNLSPDKNFFVWSITNGMCIIDDTVYVELLPDFIPQGFSPNGDGYNNEFRIEGLNLTDKQIAELSILNGAGTVVYTTTNRDGQDWIEWDGKNNKGIELPDGTYYYLLKLTTQDNKVIKKSGFIELKRY